MPVERLAGYAALHINHLTSKEGNRGIVLQLPIGAVNVSSTLPLYINQHTNIRPQVIPAGRHHGKLCDVVVSADLAYVGSIPQRHPGYRVVRVNMADIFGVLLAHYPDMEMLLELQVRLQCSGLRPE